MGECCCSFTKLCLTLCDTIDCSMLGFPVLHYLPEFAQIHVHWVSDAIKLSHPMSPPSPFNFNLSQHMGLLSMSWLFSLGVQSIGASASASVLSMNIQGWFTLGLTGLISLQSKGLKNLLHHYNSKASIPILWCLAFFMVHLSHPYMTAGKIIALTKRLLSTKWCLCFLICSLVRHDFPSKEQASFNFVAESLSTVILEPKKRKSVTASSFSPSICRKVIEPDAMILVFWMLGFKPTLPPILLPSSRGSLVPLHFLLLEWYTSHVYMLLKLCLIFSY